MSNPLPFDGDFQFDSPTKDRGYLAQLQEWANHFKVKLDWKDAFSQDENGITTVTSYPIIKEHEYPEFWRTGPKSRPTRELAACAIVHTPGQLTKARTRPPPPQTAPVHPPR